MQWPALANKIKFLTCAQEAPFPVSFQFSFFPFSTISYSDLSSTQILCPFTSKSETKLKGWSLNTEDVRCQPSPSLKDQIRFLTGTCLLPIFPYLLLPRIQSYQWPITAQVPCTCTLGSASSLVFFVFNS